MEQLFDELKNAWADFEVNHLKFAEKGNKQAAARARKALGELKKKVTAYRQASITEVKGE